MSLIGACAAAVSAVVSAAVAQPGNDVCGANRALFTVPPIGGAVNGTVTGSTRDGSACAGTFGADVYNYFTPATPGPWRLTLCGGSDGFDSVLSIHTNVCPVSTSNYATPLSGPTSCNNDSTTCSPLSQLNSVPLTPGTTYIIRVARFSGTDNVPHTYTLTVSDLTTFGACCSLTGVCDVRSGVLCSGPWAFLGQGTVCAPNPCPQPPINDLCTSAIPITVAAATISGTTALASTDGSAGCASSSRDVWYTFAPDVTGAFSLSLCDSGAPWNSVLSIHSACPGTVLNQLAGACDNDSCSPDASPGSHALIPSLNLSAGVPYVIRVAGYGTSSNNSGAFQLRINAALGSCCRAADAACSLTTHAACPGPDDWTQGQLCTSAACQSLIGACCNPANGACVQTTALGCTPPAAFAGAGLACQPTPCPQPIEGACCDAAGCCTLTLAPMCAGTFTPMVPCTPLVCGTPAPNDDCQSAIALLLNTPFVGISCRAELAGDGPEASCLAAGGAGTTWRSVWFVFAAPATAEYVISSCGSDHDTVVTVFSGDCAGLIEIGCNDDAAPACSGASASAAAVGPTVLAGGSSYLIRLADGPMELIGGQVSLVVNNLSSLGACCDDAGACALTDQPNCVASRVFTVGAACDPNPCPPPLGSCCDATGACAVTDQTTCAPDGVFAIGAACEPNPCPQPIGACCRGATCSPTTAAACAATGSSFAGVGLVCNQYPQTTGACCLADFNHAGGVTVQDLFDFLAGYFSGDTSADINSSGLVSVEDIFNYLDAFFRGGCS